MKNITDEGLPVLSREIKERVLYEAANDESATLKHEERLKTENPNLYRGFVQGFCMVYPHYSEVIVSELSLGYELLSRQLEYEKSSTKLPKVNTATINEGLEEILQNPSIHKNHFEEVKAENPIYMENLGEMIGVWKDIAHLPEDFYLDLGRQVVFMYELLKNQGKKDRK